MRTRRLGRSDLEIPVVTFGAWAIGGWYWGGADDDEAVRAIHASIDAGANALDTAPVYGFGRSERVIGRALRDRRDRAIVMTKVGLRWDDTRGEFYFETVDQDGVKRSVHRNARPWSVKREVEDSLVRLETDRIDLIQVHWPDPTTSIGETMGALLDLRAEGKVRAIGVSNFSPAQMDEAQAALGDVPLASDQPKYSLVAREAERDVLPHARAKDVGTIVYSPLDQGLLTGKVDAARAFGEADGRHKRPTFRASNRELVNAALQRTVRPVADAHGATIAQTVIAWTVAQPGVTSAIVGARTPAQAVENAGAADLRLTAEECAGIRGEFESLALDLPGKGRPRSKLATIVRRFLGR